MLSTTTDAPFPVAVHTGVQTVIGIVAVTVKAAPCPVGGVTVAVQLTVSCVLFPVPLARSFQYQPAVEFVSGPGPSTS